MATTTIKSNAVIVYNRSLDNYQRGMNSLFNQFAFKKLLTYRRYVFGEDNLSGDKDYRDYNDYDIYGELQLEGNTKSMGVSGYIESEFGFLYLPAVITEDRNGNGIPSFRPQIKDEFQFDGRWYIIENVQPNQFANSRFAIECLFRLISTAENPRTPNI